MKGPIRTKSEQIRQLKSNSIPFTCRDCGVGDNLGAHSNGKYVRSVLDGSPVKMDKLFRFDRSLNGFREVFVRRSAIETRSV